MAQTTTEMVSAILVLQTPCQHNQLRWVLGIRQYY
jgi:hypothetical protein